MKKARMKALMNNKGSGMLIAIVGMIVGGVILYTAMEFGRISRVSANYTIELDTRSKIAERLASAMEDPMVVNFTLQKFSTPATNPDLKACVMAGVPATNDSCKKVDLEFYMPVKDGSARIIGSKLKPLYANLYGDDCSRDEKTNDNRNCVYSITSQCTFVCPGSQTSCALVKVMTCAMTVESISTGAINRFTFKKKSSLSFATYAIRISNDLTAFDVVH
jgi:hypothetical protein